MLFLRQDSYALQRGILISAALKQWNPFKMKGGKYKSNKSVSVDWTVNDIFALFHILTPF